MEMQEGTVIRTYVRGINLILFQSGANTDWYLYNAHGDVVQLTGGDGTVTRSYRYEQSRLYMGQYSPNDTQEAVITCKQ